MKRTKNEKKTKAIKPTKKAVLIILASLILVSIIIVALAIILASPKAVMKYKEASIDEKMYSYWLSYFKKELMVEHGISGSDDTPDFWNTEYSEGESYAEHLCKLADDRIKAKLVAVQMYDEYGQELPDYAKTDIENYLLELVDYVGEGSKEELNRIAADYGTDYNAIKRVAECDYKIELLFNLRYGADGSYIGEAEKDVYYRDNYARIKVIFVDTKSEDLTDEQLASKNDTLALLDDIVKEEKADEKYFSELMSSYSDDKASTLYENGFYLSTSTDYPIREVVDSAFSMEVGELKRVESEYGVHYILRLELDEKAYETEENSDWFENFEYAASISAFDKMIKEKVDEVETNEREKSKVSFAKIKYNYEIKPIMN